MTKPKFFTEQVKDIVEMAVAKLPEGVKRKVVKDYNGTHDIHVDGEHVATISGYKPSSGRRNHSGTQYGKIYQVHKDVASMQDWKSEHQGHEDHRNLETHHFANYKDGKQDPDQPHITKEVYRPHTYGSMDDAVHAVTCAHRNNKEFGKGHSPLTRWAHAIKSAVGHDDHEAQTHKYKAAIRAAKDLGEGHEGVIDALQQHHDAHVAKGTKPSDEKLKQWTHDADRYTGKKHVPAKYHEGVRVSSSHDVPAHPELHDMAQKALNVRHYGHPDGSSWDRERLKRDQTMADRGHKGY